MIEQGIKTCPSSAYGDRPHSGYFAIDGPAIRWERCRENFGNTFTSSQSGLFFMCRELTPGADEDVAAFLTKTEQIIDLPSLKVPHSTFQRTDKDRVLWIKPSAFWMVCDMRRQALTIFLRSGLNYHTGQDNYEEALWSEQRARESRRAIMRFLFGYVRYIPDCESKPGWVTTFEHKDDAAIRKSLVLPDGSKEEYCVIGAGKLWHS